MGKVKSKKKNWVAMKDRWTDALRYYEYASRVELRLTLNRDEVFSTQLSYRDRYIMYTTPKYCNNNNKCFWKKK